MMMWVEIPLQPYLWVLTPCTTSLLELGQKQGLVNGVYPTISIPAFVSN